MNMAPARRNIPERSSGAAIWWISALIAITAAATATWAGDQKYAPAEQGAVTLSENF